MFIFFYYSTMLCSVSFNINLTDLVYTWYTIPGVARHTHNTILNVPRAQTTRGTGRRLDLNASMGMQTKSCRLLV